MGRFSILAVSVFLCCVAVLPLRAQEAAGCYGVATSSGGSVEPSACVAFGTRFSIRLAQFYSGQLRSVILAGPGGPVSGGDRTMRVDGVGRLLLDTNSYFGTPLGSGVYTVWVKDLAGDYPPAQVHFRVVGGDHVRIPTAVPPTPTAPPTATAPAPTATRAPTATIVVSVQPTPTASPIVEPTEIPTESTVWPTSDAEESATPSTYAENETIERVRIAFVMPDDQPSHEYILLENATNETISLTGWTLGDDDGNSVMFPNFRLEGGAQVLVWTGSGVSDATNLYLKQGTAIWDQDGDTAILLDAQGNEAARHTY